MNPTHRTNIRDLVLAALFLALGLLLPFLTGQIPQIGSMLLPMHIPILLCGFICGWRYGLAIGLITPILRSLLFLMPPMFPVAITMAFELAVYGLLAGLLYQLLAKKPVNLYLSLIGAMIGGRIMWGLAAYVFFGLNGATLTWQMFLSAALLTAWPGILVQIVLIPAIMIALKKSGRLESRQAAA